MIGTLIGWGALCLLVAGLCWWLWLDVILPRRIPVSEIERLASDLIETHGPEAETVAMMNYNRAYDRDCDMVEARRWKLVRRKLDDMRRAGRVY